MAKQFMKLKNPEIWESWVEDKDSYHGVPANLVFFQLLRALPRVAVTMSCREG